MKVEIGLNNMVFHVRENGEMIQGYLVFHRTGNTMEVINSKVSIFTDQIEALQERKKWLETKKKEAEDSFSIKLALVEHELTELHKADPENNNSKEGT